MSSSLYDSATSANVFNFTFNKKIYYLSRLVGSAMAVSRVRTHVGRPDRSKEEEKKNEKSHSAANKYFKSEKSLYILFWKWTFLAAQRQFNTSGDLLYRTEREPSEFNTFAAHWLAHLWHSSSTLALHLPLSHVCALANENFQLLIIFCNIFFSLHRRRDTLDALRVDEWISNKIIIHINYSRSYEANDVYELCSSRQLRMALDGD